MIAILSASIMTMSFVVPSALAIDTTNAEVEFALKLLNILPKERGNFDEYLKIESREDLDTDREVEVRQSDGKKKTIKLNEQKIYDEIKAKVEELKKKVEDRTPNSWMKGSALKIAINSGVKSKHYKLSKKNACSKSNISLGC